MTIDSNTKATEIVSRIQHYLENLPDFAWANFLVGNHDNRRVAGRMGEQNVDGINMMVLLIGGTAVIYNGDEIGMTNNMNISYNDSVDPQGCNYGPENYLKYSRDPERTPCQWNSNPGAGFTGDSVKPWLPINSNHVTINREFEENDPKSHLNVFKKLGRLRVEDSIQRGSIEFPYTSDNVLTFSRVKRGDGGRGFVVTINVSPNEETIDVTKDCCHDYRFPGNGTVRVASGTSGRAEGETVQLDRINLKANEALVIEFSPVL